ncbi:MAG: FeoB-associated Cys-rich membrane protein [Clostridia bacterium]|nr:FeoB-associated Cys-rich membrane protein [Clostridia bacterium]
MNAMDFVVLALVALAVTGAVLSLRRQKKQGRSCCGNCSSCSGCCSGAGKMR